MMTYLLPSDPTLLCDDPLGICDDVSPPLTLSTAWDVILKAIEASTKPVASASQLPDLIETLVYSLHGVGSLDTEGLRLFLQQKDPDTLRILYTAIYTAAISLPLLFPTHEIPYLTHHNPKISLSADQIHAILAHQLLGTLRPADGGWGPPTFICWYRGANPHATAVAGYLMTLFDYFSGLPTSPDLHVQFYLSQVAETIKWEECDVPMQITLIHIDEESEPSQKAGEPEEHPPAVVISSNRQPGFGPSGTQEERIFASSLYLCPLVLFCPVLSNNAALITSPIPVHALWRGHNRTARLAELYPQSSRPTRYYVLMDALELDVQSQSDAVMPDLVGDNIERELRKVYAGCMGVREMYPLHVPVIEAGAWGCGAFGGNAVVKGIIMAMASSRAGVQMELRLRRDRVGELELIAEVIEAGLTVAQVMTRLKNRSEDIAGFRCRDGNAFVHLLLLRLDQ
jgi:poly(ADP-ribose) glycohydrolase